MSAARLALLCLPCAGASAVLYLRWRHMLPSWIRLVPVEIPGRGMLTESAFAENFDELVAHLCNEYSSELQAPYALFGHSMGALLSYGIAQSQYAQFKPLPKMLFACASPAPSKRNQYPLADHDNENAMRAELHVRGGAPADVFDDEEMLRHTLKILAADYRVIKSFDRRESPRLPLPIHVLAGLRDEIQAEHLEAWQEETSSHFALHWFDGGHFFLRSQPERLLEQMVRGLRTFHEVPSRRSLATNHLQ